MNTDQSGNVCYVLDSPSSVVSDDIFANDSGPDVSFWQKNERSSDEQVTSCNLRESILPDEPRRILGHPLNIREDNSAYFRPISPDTVYRIDDSGNSSQRTSQSDNVNMDCDMEASVVLQESMKKITLVEDSDKSSVSILDMSVESNDFNYVSEKTTNINILSSAKKHIIKNWLSHVSLNSSSKQQYEPKTFESENLNSKNTVCNTKTIQQASNPTEDGVKQKMICVKKLSSNDNIDFKTDYSPKPLENKKLSLNSNIANIKKDEPLEKSDENFGRYNLRRNRREGKENYVNDKSNVLSSNLYFNSKEQSVCVRNPSVTKIMNETGSISVRSNKISFRQKKRLKIKSSKSGDDQEFISNIINSVISSNDDSFSSVRRKSYVTKISSNGHEEETQSKNMETPRSLFTPRRKLFFRQAHNNSLDDDICSEEPCQETLLVNNAVTSTPMPKTSRLKGLSAFISETINSTHRNKQEDTKVESNKNPASTNGQNCEILSYTIESEESCDEIPDCDNRKKSGSISPILPEHGKSKNSSLESRKCSLVQKNFERSQTSLEKIADKTVPTCSDSVSVSSAECNDSGSNFEVDIRKSCEESIGEVHQGDIADPGGGIAVSVTGNDCGQNSHSLRTNNVSESCEEGSNISNPLLECNENPSHEKELKSNTAESTNLHNSCHDSSENESFNLRRMTRNRNRINSNDFTHNDLSIYQDDELKSNILGQNSTNSNYIHDSSSKTDVNMSVDDLNKSIKMLTVANEQDKYQNSTAESDCSSNSTTKISQPLVDNENTSCVSNKLDSACEEFHDSKQIYEQSTLPVNCEESFAGIDSILSTNNDRKESINRELGELLSSSTESKDFENASTQKEGLMNEQSQFMVTPNEKSRIIDSFLFQNKNDSKKEEIKTSLTNASEITSNCSGILERSKSSIMHDANQITPTNTRNYFKDDIKEEKISPVQASNPNSQNISTIVLSDCDDSFSNICRSKTPLKKNQLNYSMDEDVIIVDDVKDFESPKKSTEDRRRKKKSFGKYNPEVLIFKANDSSFSSDNEDNNDCHQIVNSSDDSVKSSSSSNEGEPWVDLATYLKKNVPAATESDFPKISKRSLADVQLPEHSSCPEHTSFLLSLTDSVPENMCHPDAIKYRESFNTHKNSLIDILFKLYNQEIFDNKLPVIEIKWSGHLTTTSGITRSTSRITSNGKVRTSGIKLSKTIVDSASKLRDVLIHELCHAANWLIDEQAGGHGPLFKKWANKVWLRFPEIPKVKVCHRYELKWKYLYKCTYCGYELGKMKFSLKEDSCRLCGGRVTVNPS